MTRFPRTPQPIHVPAPQPSMDDQADVSPVPGSPENALALFAHLDTIQRHMDGPERLAAMNEFAARQAQHLQAVTGLQHQTHALVVTPAIQVGHLELGPLLIGSVLTLGAGAALALGLGLGLGAILLGMTVFWLVCTALLNAALRAARRSAVRQLVNEVQPAEIQTPGDTP